MSEQPSAGALEAANSWVYAAIPFDQIEAWHENSLARALDAFAAAALTDEQRDVWRSTVDALPPPKDGGHYSHPVLIEMEPLFGYGFIGDPYGVGVFNWQSREWHSAEMRYGARAVKRWREIEHATPKP